MSDRTGMALGRIRPAVYFEAPNGRIVLPPEEIGQGTALARKIYEERYKAKKYEWREAGTWPDLVRLQDRLIEQEMREAAERRDTSMMRYDVAKSVISESMRLRMQSADCSQFERDFLECWLRMNPEKRAKYEQRFREYQSYLWAVEQDPGTKVEDRMPAQPGEFWRNEQQQKS